MDTNQISKKYKIEYNIASKIYNISNNDKFIDFIIRNLIFIDFDNEKLEEFADFYFLNKRFIDIDNVNLSNNIEFEKQPNLQKFFKMMNDDNFFEKYEINLDESNKYYDVLLKKENITLIKLKTKDQYSINVVSKYFDFYTYNIIIFENFKPILKASISENGYISDINTIKENNIAYKLLIEYIKSLPLISEINYRIEKEYMLDILKLKNVKLVKNNALILYSHNKLSKIPDYVIDDMTKFEKIKYNIKLNDNELQFLNDVQKYYINKDISKEVLNDKYEEIIKDNAEIQKLSFIEKIYIINEFYVSIYEIFPDILKDLKEYKVSSVDLRSSDLVFYTRDNTLISNLYADMYGFSEENYYIFGEFDRDYFSNYSEYEYADNYLTDDIKKQIDEILTKYNIHIKSKTNEDENDVYYKFFNKIGLKDMFDTLFSDITYDCIRYKNEKLKELQEEIIFDIYNNYQSVEIYLDKLLKILAENLVDVDKFSELFKTEFNIEFNTDMNDSYIIQKVSAKEANEYFQKNLEENLEEALEVYFDVNLKNETEDILSKLKLKIGENIIDKGEFYILLDIENSEIDDNNIIFNINRTLYKNNKLINKTSHKIKSEKISDLMEINLFDK